MDQTSEARVKEIEERLQKASPGPWIVPTANIHRVIALHEDGNPNLLIVEHPNESAWYGQDNISYFRLGSEEGGRQSAANARFIAHAPDDIRYLLDELKKAREALRAIARRANESGIDILAERETIYAMHGIAREALKDKK